MQTYISTEQYHDEVKHSLYVLAFFDWCSVFVGMYDLVILQFADNRLNHCIPV